MGLYGGQTGRTSNGSAGRRQTLLIDADDEPVCDEDLHPAFVLE